jgi:hypothetical protein
MSLMKKLGIGATLGLASLAGNYDANADVIVQTIPEYSVVQPGDTQRFHVYVDNTGMDATTGAQWKAVANPNFTITNSSLPASNDFFAGQGSPYFQTFSPTGINARGYFTGPVDRQGYVGTFDATINGNASLGNTSLDLTDLQFINSSLSSEQPFQFSQRDFLVVNKIGDLDNDGDVDNVDIGRAIGNFTGAGESTSMTYWEGDLDNDGDVDIADINAVAERFTGGAISQSNLGLSLDSVLYNITVPEPASLALLGLGAGAIASSRRRERKR